MLPTPCAWLNPLSCCATSHAGQDPQLWPHAGGRVSAPGAAVPGPKARGVRRAHIAQARSPLRLAVMFRNVDAVVALINGGASIQDAGSLAYDQVLSALASALSIALRRGLRRVVSALTQEGIVSDFRAGRSVLRQALVLPPSSVQTAKSKDAVLGAGAFGVVVKGVMRGGAPVAIKRVSLRRVLASFGSMTLDALWGELEAQALLQHPNIVSTLGGFVDEVVPVWDGDEGAAAHAGGSMPYYASESGAVAAAASRRCSVLCTVLELLDGGSLDRAQRDMSLTQRIAALRDVAAALAYLHAGGSRPGGAPLVHADLKPSNVLLAGTPSAGTAVVAKLSDFGLTRQHVEQASAAHADGVLVRSGAELAGTGALASGAPTVLGDIGYRAPELLGGAAPRQATTASDVYAWALTAWEVLSGQVGVVWSAHAGSVRDIAASVTAGWRPALATVVDAWRGAAPAKAVAALIARCWDADAERRPTAAALVGALESVIATGDVVESAGAAVSGTVIDVYCGVPGLT